MYVVLWYSVVVWFSFSFHFFPILCVKMFGVCFVWGATDVVINYISYNYIVLNHYVFVCILFYLDKRELYILIGWLFSGFILVFSCFSFRKWHKISCLCAVCIDDWYLHCCYYSSDVIWFLWQGETIVKCLECVVYSGEGGRGGDGIGVIGTLEWWLGNEDRQKSSYLS